MDGLARPLMHLDTHVLVWLYAGDSARVPPSIRSRIAREAPVISPMVAVELQLLHEIGRLQEPARAVLDDLEARIGLTLDPTASGAAAAAALTLNWTRDPFDRLIVATALAAGKQLATRDETIRANFPLAVWD